MKPRIPVLSAQQLTRILSKSVSKAGVTFQRVSPKVLSGVKSAAPYLMAMTAAALDQAAQRSANPDLTYFARNQKKIQNSATVMNDAVHHFYRLVKK